MIMPNATPSPSPTSGVPRLSLSRAGTFAWLLSRRARSCLGTATQCVCVCGGARAAGLQQALKAELMFHKQKEEKQAVQRSATKEREASKWVEQHRARVRTHCLGARTHASTTTHIESPCLGNCVHGGSITTLPWLTCAHHRGAGRAAVRERASCRVP
jgi:hypothetical protein